MHVLHITLGRRGRHQAQVALHSLVPSRLQPCRIQFSGKQGRFQFKTQHNMQVVGYLIRLYADQRRLHAIGGPLEAIQAQGTPVRISRESQLFPTQACPFEIMEDSHWQRLAGRGGLLIL